MSFVSQINQKLLFLLIHRTWEEKKEQKILAVAINIVPLRPNCVINRTADRPWEGAKGASFRDFYKDNKNKKINIQQTTISISMKKFTLLLCLFVVSVMMPQWVQAQAQTLSATAPSIVKSATNDTLTITSAAVGELYAYVVTNASSHTSAITTMKGCTKLVLKGKFNSTDLDAITTSGDDFNFVTVDMAGAEFLSSSNNNRYDWYPNTNKPASANLGAKCIEGGTLLKASVTQNPYWDDPYQGDTPSSYHDYNSVSDRNSHQHELEDGAFARIPATFNYYKMTVTKSWNGPVDEPASGTEFLSYDANSYSEANKPNPNDFQTDRYIRFPLYDYYRMDVTKVWTPISSNESVNPEEKADWAGKDLTQPDYLNPYNDNGKCIKISSYAYYLIKQEEGVNNNQPYVDVDHPVFDISGIDESLINDITGWGVTTENVSNHAHAAAPGYYLKVTDTNNTQYFRLDITKSWVGPLSSGENAQDPNFAVENMSNSENMQNYSDGQFIRFLNGYHYYKVQESRSWSDAQSTDDGIEWVDPDPNFLESELEDHKDAVGNNQGVRFVATYSYSQFHSGVICNWDESNDAVTQVDFYFPTETEKNNNNSATSGQYAVLGGTAYVYKTSGWSTDFTPEPDYSAMKFTNWSSTLQTAVLPNNVTVADCPNDLFKGCNALTEVKHNVNNVEKSAKITIETGKITVNKAEEAGLFKLLLNSDEKLFDKNAQTERFADGTVFVFSNDCSQLSGADLAALAGNMKGNDPLNHNKFYVDLFDVPVASPSTIGTAINDAISIMREKNWQYKGLLFPGNLSSASTQVIKDGEKLHDYDENTATCSEFVGYNKLNNTITTMHIYSANHSGYQDSFDKLKTMMNLHPVIAQNTTSYLVSTNSPSEFDTSSLPTTNADVILAVNDDMVNPVPGAKAGVSVTLAGAGHFATLVANTGIKDTPVDSLKITGNVNIDDISAVSAYVDGPRVLNLKAAVPTEKIVEEQSDDFDDKAMLETLENNKIEFIILHSGKSKDVVCSADTSKLKSLKAVISSNKRGDANPALVAYVNVPGSLAEARCLATGSNGNAGPTPQNLNSVTLSGKLRNSDISTPNGSNNGLANEKGTIQTLDLGDAVFVNSNGVITSTEMNFHVAGFHGDVEREVPEIVLTKVILPTHEDMDTLTNNCLYQMKSLTELCIPYNYKVILSGALNETALDHITTTSDYNGVLVDNGPKTYTLSANLEQIGDEPEISESTLNGTYPVFPKNNGVRDLYTLATQVPKCYKDAFGMDLATGYGGQDQTKVYCRERYFNNGEADKAFVILHIPNLESYNISTDPDKENTYSDMVKKYTDDTKKYTKLDQTGAVDGNGNPLRWPTHLEMLRVYKQASAGLLWDAWSEGHDTDEHGFKVQDGPSNGEPNINVSTPFRDYIGWHQIVLCLSSYVAPKETPNEKKEIIRNYTNTKWYTFCIPYDLTYSQVLEMMGVPASDTEYDPKTGLKVINKVGDTEVKTNLMPDIRQLKAVVRKKGSNEKHNVVDVRMTKNLFKGSRKGSEESKETYYLDFTEQGNSYSSGVETVAGGDAEDPICLKGGRPYYIQPYVRSGETISKSNLGNYIMTHYADSLNLAASCINSGEDYCENLEIFSYDENRKVIGIDDGVNAQKVGHTMSFAKPYEKHKVQAVEDSEENAGQVVYTVEKNGVEVDYRYYYTMVGQFWEQDLPEYCFYMSGPQWCVYTDVTKKYKWSPYKCVIMATPEEITESDISAEDIAAAYTNKAETAVPLAQQPASTPIVWDEFSFNHFGGGFRDISKCYFPMNMPGTQNWLLNPFTLCFHGRDDSVFDSDKSVGAYKGNVGTRYIFSFDDDENIVELDAQENDATHIETIDGVPQFTSDNMKVYNLSGQYVGRSTEGLSKGIYIVGGRKIVVE